MEPITTGMVFETRDDFFTVVEDAETMQCAIEAFKLGALAAAHKYARLALPPEFAEREFICEYATRMRIPEGTAEARIATADALVDEFPTTLDALRSGTISYRHAEKLVDHAHSLPQESWAAFEAAVLPIAQSLTVAKFDNRARKLRERMHPDSITQRRKSAFEKRDVTIAPGSDGMCWMTAHIPAEHAFGIINRLDDIAGSLHPDDERTLPQRRADAFCDILIDGDPANAAHRGIRAEVSVTIPMLTVLGRSDEPAELDGYGPIPAEVARDLCASATSFTRLLTDPVNGTVLTLDRVKRLPTKTLRRWLIHRDGTCRFPGCNRRARKADIDHTIPWENGGKTDVENLECLCPHHHRVKHNTRWRVEQLGNGVLGWTSPDGKIYITRPDPTSNSPGSFRMPGSRQARSAEYSRDHRGVRRAQTVGRGTPSSGP